MGCLLLGIKRCVGKGPGSTDAPPGPSECERLLAVRRTHGSQDEIDVARGRSVVRVPVDDETPVRVRFRTERGGSYGAEVKLRAVEVNGADCWLVRQPRFLQHCDRVAASVRALNDHNHGVGTESAKAVEMAYPARFRPCRRSVSRTSFSITSISSGCAFQSGQSRSC